MMVSGVSSALQEISASWLTNQETPILALSPMVLKMALHGVLIKAPISQALAALSQRLFRGYKGTKAKMLQFLVNQLVIAPAQNTIFLTTVAILYGARSWPQIRSGLRAGLPLIMKITWVASPLALAFAQAFLPEQSWPIFFNVLAFVVGTCVSTVMKRRRIAALRRQNGSDADVKSS